MPRETEIVKQEQDQNTYRIIGAAMEVHRHLGPGLVETVYQEALACEFNERGIKFKREVEIPLFYKGKRLGKYFRVDFTCFMPEPILVELKAMADLTNVERAIVLNYLYLSGYDLGLLLNFGKTSLQYERFVNKRTTNRRIKGSS